jgi:Ala-tRNA(Pro) deacylase
MLTCLERLQRLLREQHMAYSIQHHRETFTMQQVAAELHAKGDHVAKVVIAKADGQLVMLVVPAPEHVDFERVAAVLRVDAARAAHENEFTGRFPDCDPGAMPPFGHLYDMPTYVDETLTRTNKLIFQAGTHRDTITLATADYLRLAQPSTANVIQQPSTLAARG